MRAGSALRVHRALARPQGAPIDWPRLLGGQGPGAVRVQAGVRPRFGKHPGARGLSFQPEAASSSRRRAGGCGKGRSSPPS